MKNLLLITFILFYSLHSKGQNPQFYQNGEYHPYYETAVFDKKERSQYKKANIKVERRIQVSNKKGDIMELEQTFNTDGAVIKNQRKKWNRNKYFTIDYSYNTIGDIISIQTIRPNTKKEFVNYKYNAENLRVEYRKSSEKKGLLIKVETEYQGESISMRSHYIKSSESPKHKWAFQFHEDSTRKQTDYFKKGKLKYTWHYECDPAGKLVQEKHKDTSTVCIREETDANGNLVKYIQNTNEKGKITISKTTFNVEGEAIASEVNKLDGTPISYWKHTDVINIYKQYRKGKLRYENITNYDSNGNAINNTYNHAKKKWSSTKKYVYNNEGLLTEAKSYNHKNRLNYTYRYEREFY